MRGMTDLDRLAQPLIEVPAGDLPSNARQLTVDRCDVRHARVLNERWHSRLPETQAGPWMAAYRAAYDGITYAVALWNSPSARTLPAGLLELRRMAVACDAPHCTASRFLAQMAKRIRVEFPAVHRLISYQDAEVHTGTIYRAAGWHMAHISQPRIRDRSRRRAGTQRMYRWNLNGVEPDGAAKVRWEWDLPTVGKSRNSIGETICETHSNPHNHGTSPANQGVNRADSVGKPPEGSTKTCQLAAPLEFRKSLLGGIGETIGETPPENGALSDD